MWPLPNTCYLFRDCFINTPCVLWGMAFSTVHAWSSFGIICFIFSFPSISSWAGSPFIFPCERPARIINRADFAFFIAWKCLVFFKFTNDTFQPSSDYCGILFVVFLEVITTILAFINSFLRKIASWAFIYFFQISLSEETLRFFAFCNSFWDKTNENKKIFRNFNAVCNQKNRCFKLSGGDVQKRFMPSIWGSASDLKTKANWLMVKSKER